MQHNYWQLIDSLNQTISTVRFLKEIKLEALDNMIRECSRHGYYSDDHLCPACNEEGKFILRSRERDSLARRLALILRHAPEKFDLEMDIKGWVDFKVLISRFKKHNDR